MKSLSLYSALTVKWNVIDQLNFAQLSERPNTTMTMTITITRCFRKKKKKKNEVQAEELVDKCADGKESNRI